MPFLITNIYEHKDVYSYLEKHQLIESYYKIKKLLLQGNFSTIQLKLRKPKTNRIFQFRLTKKYRCYCIIKDTTCTIFKIDDHQ